MWRLHLKVMLLVVILYPSQITAAAATTNSFYNPGGKNSNTRNLTTDRRNVEPTLQLNFQFGHQQQLGTTTGLGTLFPLMHFKNGGSSFTLLGDLHIERTNSSKFYSAGLGTRYYNHVFIAGLFGYFDTVDLDLWENKDSQSNLDSAQVTKQNFDATRKLQQITISAEILYSDWELHANYYIPTSDSIDLSSQLINHSGTSSTPFKQLPAQLLYEGYEVEIGANIAKKWQQDSYLYLSYYDFQTDLQAVNTVIDSRYDQMTGWRLHSRNTLRKTAISQLILDAEYNFRDDDFGDEEYYIGLSYQLNFGRNVKRIPTGVSAKIMNRTMRHYTVRQELLRSIDATSN